VWFVDHQSKKKSIEKTVFYEIKTGTATKQVVTNWELLKLQYMLEEKAQEKLDIETQDYILSLKSSEEVKTIISRLLYVCDKYMMNFQKSYFFVKTQ